MCRMSPRPNKRYSGIPATNPPSASQAPPLAAMAPPQVLLPTLPLPLSNPDRNPLSNALPPLPCNFDLLSPPWATPFTPSYPEGVAFLDSLPMDGVMALETDLYVDQGCPISEAPEEPLMIGHQQDPEQGVEMKAVSRAAGGDTVVSGREEGGERPTPHKDSPAVCRTVGQSVQRAEDITKQAMLTWLHKQAQGDPGLHPVHRGAGSFLEAAQGEALTNQASAGFARSRRSLSQLTMLSQENHQHTGGHDFLELPEQEMLSSSQAELVGFTPNIGLNTTASARALSQALCPESALKLPLSWKAPLPGTAPALGAVTSVLPPLKGDAVGVPPAPLHSLMATPQGYAGGNPEATGAYGVRVRNLRQSVVQVSTSRYLTSAGTSSLGSSSTPSRALAPGGPWDREGSFNVGAQQLSFNSSSIAPRDPGAFSEAEGAQRRLPDTLHLRTRANSCGAAPLQGFSNTATPGRTGERHVERELKRKRSGEDEGLVHVKTSVGSEREEEEGNEEGGDGDGDSRGGSLDAVNDPSKSLSSKSVTEKKRRARISEAFAELRQVVSGHGDMSAVLKQAVQVIKQQKEVIQSLQTRIFLSQGLNSPGFGNML